MSDKKRILIIEDDADIRMIEEIYIQSSGMETVSAESWNEARKKLEENSFDLILLDIMLPDVNGYEICRQIRKTLDIPILMVTAKTELADKLKGLNVGADDYILKPFDPVELVARINANIRQYERLTGKSTENAADVSTIKLGNIEIDLNSRRVYKNGEEIKMPNREFELLRFMAENPNIVFSKEQLFEKIWGYDYVGDSATVTVHINRIREKIEDDSKDPKILETVWGAGYRLNK